jgi:D-alanyl-D-alanine carboxypeptidase
LGAETAKVLPKSQNINPPILTATSAMVKDLDNDFVFFVKDSDKRVPIASTTKIMTSIIASEYFKQNEILVVPEVASVSGSTMGLKTGEKLTFRSLIYGLMLNSGNDAAFTIAASYPGGVNAFVDAMNNKALSLGLVNTHFDNPAGFDSPNHYSSAADLAKIAAIAAENPQLARVFVTKETSVTSIDRANVHQLKNLNKLLDLPGVLGIKTGFTPAAKENFVGLIERDNHRILTVVLGSDDRFGETQKLMDWVFANFIWE